MVKCPNCGTEVRTTELDKTLLKLKRVEMGTDIPY